MKNKILSVFVDESGDFGQYNPSSPNYYVAMVLHDQEKERCSNNQEKGYLHRVIGHGVGILFYIIYNRYIKKCICTKNSNGY